jgi:hypothetical protein
VNPVEGRICAALVNRNLTHNSFRVYAAMVLLLDGKSSRERTTAVSVPVLKELIPGVRGKQPGETAFRDALRELQEEGLIEIIGPQWSKVQLHLRLLELREDPASVLARIKQALLNVPGWIRSSR